MEGETNATLTDHEIARGVHILLRQSLSDPLRYGAVNSLNDVVQLLSSMLGIDLSHKSGLIRDQINLFCHLLPPYTAVSTDHLHSHQFQLQYQNRAVSTDHLHSHQFQLQYQNRAHLSMIEDHQVVAVTPASQAKDHVHVSPPPVKVSKESTQAGAKRRGGAGGLNKLCGVSPELQVVVGESAMARTEIVKKLWAYIRKHNLQDPSNKRKIICDEALRVVLETDCTDMFKMNKLLAKHILPLDPSKDFVQSKRQKVDVEVTAEPTEGMSPVMISDALALFLGTTKKAMLASEAQQGVLEYIKVNSLEVAPTAAVQENEVVKTSEEQTNETVEAEAPAATTEAAAGVAQEEAAEAPVETETPAPAEEAAAVESEVEEEKPAEEASTEVPVDKSE